MGGVQHFVRRLCQLVLLSRSRRAVLSRFLWSSSCVTQTLLGPLVNSCFVSFIVHLLRPSVLSLFNQLNRILWDILLEISDNRRYNY